MNIDPAAPQPDHLGIDGYSDSTLIGQGGYGRVYRATQVSFDRIVAVKVLMSDGSEGDQLLDAERRAIGAVSSHPQIVTVLDSGIDPLGRPFIVMDHMPGGSLADRLADRGAMPWQEAIGIGIKLAGAVETAHRHGILHRDIKPENVLVSAYGEPKLADFGIAQLVAGSHTHSGAITGTLAYVAPEILNGDDFTGSADVYSLAATVFAMIDGQPPFTRSRGEPLGALVARIVSSPVPDLAERGVPRAVTEVISAALSKHPLDRPNSAAAFGTALQQAQVSTGQSPTGMFVEGDEGAPGFAVARRDSLPSDDKTISRSRSLLIPSVPTPPRRPHTLALASAAVILVGSVAGLAIAIDPPATEPTPQRSIPAAMVTSPPPAPSSEVDGGAGNHDLTKKAPRHRHRRRPNRSHPIVASAPVTLSAPSGSSTTATPTDASSENESAAAGKEEHAAVKKAQPPPPPNNQLYHLYYPKTGDHYYTNDTADRTYKMALGYEPVGVEGKMYIRRYPNTIPLITNDGTVGFVFKMKMGNTIPLYYLKTRDQSDLFTISADYRDAAIDDGWRYVGVYGWVGPMRSH
jgi:serine/threonine protein kinase